ncbi:hypothetical protein BASA81_000877 [Batrachochytrium salamandrivorans]|nr:hypothetical protein BASA81_000877 [Batrachochytrium salamandrivorans]
MSATGTAGEVAPLDKPEPAPETELAKTLEKLSVAPSSSSGGEDDPTLSSGELVVRQAGKQDGEPCDVEKVTSFSQLPLADPIKISISKKGWQTMSKIQQIGIPLFLSNPPRHMLAQAQAGTGKTGTFVLSCLGRMDLDFLKVDVEDRLSKPQAIILAITQELVTQIAQVVNELGQDLGVHARRIMSGEQQSKDGSSAPVARGRGGNQNKPKADWVLPNGADYQEQVIVGTPGKVKAFLMEFERHRKPHIDASRVKVLVVDEADQALVNSLSECEEIARRMPSTCQIGLFSATYKEELKPVARKMLGNDLKLFHEIVLRKEDLTLDKVDNFFCIVGSESDSMEQMYEKKYQAVLDIWESASGNNFVGQSMIFVNRKERAQALADFLRSRGFGQVGQIHGDMDKMEREKVFQEFLDNKRPALVATNVLSRGIDNPNVILVINMDLPEVKGIPDAENFVHRIGRSGRWTRRGASISLLSANQQFPDKRIMKDIERKLFVEVNRPLLQVQEPGLMGEAMAKAKAQRQVPGNAKHLVPVVRSVAGAWGAGGAAVLCAASAVARAGALRVSERKHLGFCDGLSWGGARVHRFSARAAPVVVACETVISNASTLVPNPHNNMAFAPSGYLKPPPSLGELVDDPTPSVLLSPNKEFLLTYDFPSHLSLVDVCQPEMRVAGMRFNPKLRCASRIRWSSWAKLRNLVTNTEFTLAVPLRMRRFTFSKSNKYLAFLVDEYGQTELWIASTATGVTERMIGHVSMVLSSAAFQWTDGDLLLTKTFDPTLPAPVPPLIPPEPVVQESLGGKAAPARTYHDLITSEYDEQVYEYYGTSRLVVCNPMKPNHSITISHEDGMYTSIELSPDGTVLLVKKDCKPFSKLLPAHRFSFEIFLLRFPAREDFNAKSVLVPFVTVPVQENLSTSFDARPIGPRDVEFAWSEPHTLAYIKSMDGGEPINPGVGPMQIRDAFMFYDIDHNVERQVFAGKLRIDSVYWANQTKLIITESWYKTREENCFVVDLTRNQEQPLQLYTRSSDDLYASWGSPQMEYFEGHWRCKQRPSDGAIMFVGSGAGPNGSRPFIDFVDLTSGTRDRMWRCVAGPNPKFPEDLQNEPRHQPILVRQEMYQRPLAIVWANTAPFFLEQDAVFVVSETLTEPPNVFLMSIPSNCILRQITTFPNPQPSLLGVKKELIRYVRKMDGVELSAELYLPANYVPGTKLPLLCWAYPQEFKNKEHASQVQTSPYRFIRTGWSQPTLWLARGWAVLDQFSVPIVAQGNEEPNDFFTEQLVASAQAAVDECVLRGVADRTRCAVGGHSYGAYMTCHLLANANGLFKAGIARSGAYNRTLTPMGYQSEERTFWQAPEMYLKNSPFAQADKINDPVLLIHGKDDANPGTHTFQTERMFSALQGLGKKAKMVLLPYERHSYDAIESVLHVVAEQDAFLVKHVLGGVAQKEPEHEPTTKRARI